MQPAVIFVHEGMGRPEKGVEYPRAELLRE